MPKPVTAPQIPATADGLTCSLPNRLDKAARGACLVGRSVAYIPEDAPLVMQLRRSLARLENEPGPSQVADLYLAEHPLPLASDAVAPRGASTFLIGTSGQEVLFLDPPAGCLALTAISYLPIGSHRVADPASADLWRESGCFDVWRAPAELLCEAVGLLGLKGSVGGGAHDADRHRLDAYLQSDADAVGQLFTRLCWLHLIKHRVRLRGFDRPFNVATVPAVLAARAYTEIYGTGIQVPYSRTSSGAVGPHRFH